MNHLAIRVESLSKLYRLGEIGTGTLSHDLQRWYARASGREDPFSKIGEVNDRKTLSKSGYVWALKDLNFEVERGQVFGIIGQNGAGKSTMLKILSKITTQTKGKVYLQGRIASLLEVGTGFHPDLTGRENIFMNGSLLGMRRKEILSKFDEIVEFSGVNAYIDTPVKRYSSGMYVRLAFAVAAFLEPEILIIDEVLAVGDAEFQQKCIGKMKSVSHEYGRTVLFVSHNLTAVSKLCSHGILLNNGRIENLGEIRDVVNSYTKLTSSYNEVHFQNEIVKYLKAEQSEDTLKFTLHYRTDTPLDLPNFGFVVSDLEQTRLFGSNPKLQPAKIPLRNHKEGIIEAVVSQPKLLDGTYLLSVWFGDSQKDYFIKENVLKFNVVNMAKNNFSNSLISGPVSPEVSWSQSEP